MAATKVSSYLDRRYVFSDIDFGERDDVMRAVVERLSSAEAFPEDKSTAVLRAILKRERVGTTGIGRGIAIPHCKTSAVERPILAFARVKKPIPYGATDGEPVHSLFMVISPATEAEEHVQILRWIAKIARSDYYASVLRNTWDEGSLFDLFNEIDEQD